MIMKKTNKAQLAAMGTVVLSGLAANVSADANPFAMTELSGGYMQVAADTHNKVTEAGCGASAKADAKAAHDEHAGHVKKAEGSCGAGQCGAMMKDGKMKPGMESSCGAMMKGHDGACGMSGMSDMKHDDAGKAVQMACGAKMKDSETSCGAKMHGGH
jgi:uncharacterized low-complexity protein